jgi:two-component system, OmpR family, response regulator
LCPTFYCLSRYTNGMKKILIIDDDAQLAKHLKMYFERYDLALESAEHPDDGIKMIDTLKPDLVLLDVMLPDRDGFAVCREIRQKSTIPVIMLTARGDVMDRVVGLELGADDYVPKPFEPRELVARVQNILKRVQGTEQAGEVISYGPLSVDTHQRTASLNNEALQLTTMEYQLLQLFVQSPGKNFSRDEILNQLRGIEAELFTRSVDISVSRLRKKLQPLDYIKTVWGAGYCFIAPREG